MKRTVEGMTLERLQVIIEAQTRAYYEELQKAADNIKHLNGNVLGVVINDVSERNSPYTYSSYKYKSYDYEYKK